MSELMVPLCVPVELRLRLRGGKAPGPRWFRLALGISEDAIRLRTAVPEELRGEPLQVRLQLPGDVEGAEAADAPAPGLLELSAMAEEVVVDQGEESERAEPRQLRLRADSEAARARIAGYVQRRLLT